MWFDRWTGAAVVVGSCWIAMGRDWQRVTIATAIIAVVGVLGVHVPW